MNLKKITACFAAVLMSTAAANLCSVYAEETSSEEKNLTDSSGIYEYSLSENNTAVIEKYLSYDDENVEIPSELDGIKVTGLGKYAYYEHEEIKSVFIPETIEDFGEYSFYGDIRLEEFEVDENNELYCVNDDGCLVGTDGLVFMYYPTNKKGDEYTIADGIVAIQSCAFACNPYIKKVNLPEGLEPYYFGQRIFAECTALEEVTMPESLTEISDFCFAACKSLKKIDLNSNVTYIGNGAFYRCTSLEAPTIPLSLTNIGQAAFVATGFDEIAIPPTVTNIGYSAFGFDIDESENFVAKKNFIVKGYEGSTAQSYCLEEDIDFVTLKEEVVEESSDESSDSEEDIEYISNEKKSESDNAKKNRIVITVVAASLAAVAIIVVVTIRSSKKKAAALLKSEDSADYSEDETIEETENNETEKADETTEEETDGEV